MSNIFSELLPTSTSSSVSSTGENWDNNSLRMATVQPDFDPELGELPKVLFDGELDYSEEGYSWMWPYIPIAGDRVLMIRITSEWFILGSISDEANAWAQARHDLLDQHEETMVLHTVNLEEHDALLVDHSLLMGEHSDLLIANSAAIAAAELALGTLEEDLAALDTSLGVLNIQLSALQVDLDAAEAEIDGILPIEYGDLAAGLYPIRTVGSLPVLPDALYPQGATVLLSSDNKLYRSTGTLWLSSVPTADLTGTIAEVQIAADAVTAAKIATGAVGSNQIAAGAVIAGKIAAGSIVAADIAASTITGAKIAAGTIAAGNIVAGTITATEIATSAITSDKILAGAVIAAKIAAGAVEADKLAANSVVAGKIAAGTIVAADIATGTITATQIATGTITANNILGGTITGAKIAAGTITATNITTGTITALQIASGTITATEIASGTITADRIAAGTITGDRIAGGTITGTLIAGGTITGTLIAGTTITASNIAADTITSNQIATDAITANELSALNLAVGKYLRSTSYVAGVSGWSLNAAGDLEANSGTFRGALAAATGTFAGSLSAATGTFAGSLTAASGTFVGALDVGGADATSFHVDTAGNMWLGASTFASAPFKVSSAGEVTATTGTYSGALSAATGTFAGSLSAATGTFAGSLSAATGTFTGSVSITSGGVTTTLDTNGLKLPSSTSMSGPDADINSTRWVNGSGDRTGRIWNGGSITGGLTVIEGRGNSGQIALLPTGVVGDGHGIAITIGGTEIGDKLTIPNGTAASPSVVFSGSTTTGMYRVAAGEIGFSGAGTRRMLINSAGITIDTSGTAAAPAVVIGAGSNGIFRSDANYAGSGLNGIGFTVGNLNVLGATADGAVWLPAVISAVSSGNANLTAGGRLTRNSSTLDLKRNLEPLDDAAEVLSSLQRAAVSFEYINFDTVVKAKAQGFKPKEMAKIRGEAAWEPERRPGFIAEYVAEAKHELGDFDDEGKVTYYQPEAISAYLVAGWNLHDQRFDAQDKALEGLRQEVADLKDVIKNFDKKLTQATK